MTKETQTKYYSLKALVESVQADKLSPKDMESITDAIEEVTNLALRRKLDDPAPISVPATEEVQPLVEDFFDEVNIELDKQGSNRRVSLYGDLDQKLGLYSSLAYFFGKIKLVDRQAHQDVLIDRKKFHIEVEQMKDRIEFELDVDR